MYIPILNSTPTESGKVLGVFKTLASAKDAVKDYITHIEGKEIEVYVTRRDDTLEIDFCGECIGYIADTPLGVLYPYEV